MRLRNVMDAFVLGAVPPYRELLCGKLVAMLAASDEVRDAFRLTSVAVDQGSGGNTVYIPH